MDTISRDVQSTEVISIFVREHKSIQAAPLFDSDAPLSMKEKKRARSFANRVINQLCARDDMFSPISAPPITPEERDALRLLFKNSEYEVLRREPTAEATSLKAARQEKSRYRQEFVTAKPHLGRRDFVLAFALPKEFTTLTTSSPVIKDSAAFASRRVGGDKQSTYVRLVDIDKCLYVPLTSQKVKHLTKMQRAFEKKAEESFESSGMFFKHSADEIRKYAALANALGILIDGVKLRADPKAAKHHKNQMAPYTRHRNHLKSVDYLEDQLAVAHAQGIPVIGEARLRREENARRKEQALKLKRIEQQRQRSHRRGRQSMPSL